MFIMLLWFGFYQAKSCICLNFIHLVKSVGRGGGGLEYMVCAGWKGWTCFIGSGSFAIVERGVYNSTQIVSKKLHDGTSSDIKKIFTKEAHVLAKVAHENTVSTLSVWDKPVSIMVELCKLSFILFGGTEVVNYLDKLLILMSEESYFTSFPGIGNVISRDITNAIASLHGKDILHRDQKPVNTLVSKSNYSNLQGVDLKLAYEKTSIICKLGDLGEARSQAKDKHSFHKNWKICCFWSKTVA